MTSVTYGKSIYGKCNFGKYMYGISIMANVTEPSPSGSVTPKWIRRYSRVKTWF